MRKGVCMMILLFALVVYPREWHSFGGNPGEKIKHVFLESGIDRMTIEVDVPGMWMEDTIAGGEIYTKIGVPGAGKGGNPGEPLVPEYRIPLIVPYDGEVSVTVIGEEHEEIPNVNLFPVQAPLMEASPLPYLSCEPPFVKNEKIYNTPAPYPSEFVKIVGPMDIRDFRFVYLTISPVVYYPIEKKIRIYYRLVVDIETAGYTRLSRWGYITPEFVSLYSALFQNYNVYSTKLPVKTINRFKNGAKYLIITHDDFYNAAIKIARWKQQKGIPVRLTKFSEINTSNPDTLDIQNYIESLWDTAAVPPVWILLVGDVDYLPCRYHYYSRNEIIPTDHKYACMDFDNGGDVHADAYIGRIPANTLAEADSMITKVVEYERNPYLTETAWYKKALGMAVYQSGRIFDETVRIIRGWLLNYGGYTQVDTLNEGQSTRAARIDTIEKGRTFVIYRGHGDLDGWYDDGGGTMLHQDDVEGMVNGRKYHVVIAPTCLANKFDENTTVMSESFFRACKRHGAAGYHGATEASWSYYNDSLAKGIFRAILNLPPVTYYMYHFQEACNYGKEYMAQTYAAPEDDDVAYAEFMLMNILGDPEMNLWTDIPSTFSVTHPGTLFVNEDNTFTVKVSTGKAPVEDAFVAVVDDSGAVYETQYTDAAGNATFTVNPPYEDTVWFTVTKRNFVPYEGFALAIHSTALKFGGIYAASIPDGIRIVWKAPMDDGRDWVIEREVEGKKSIVGTVPGTPGAISRTYEFVDRNAIPGKLHVYRVGKKGTGGEVEYLGRIEVIYSPVKERIWVENGTLRITAGAGAFSIYDLAGRLLTRFVADRERTSFAWTPPTPGVYLVRIEDSSGARTQKVLILR